MEQTTVVRTVPSDVMLGLLNPSRPRPEFWANVENWMNGPVATVVATMSFPKTWLTLPDTLSLVRLQCPVLPS